MMKVSRDETTYLMVQAVEEIQKLSCRNFLRWFAGIPVGFLWWQIRSLRSVLNNLSFKEHREFEIEPSISVECRAHSTPVCRSQTQTTLPPPNAILLVHG